MAEERPDLEKYVGQSLAVVAWLWTRTVKSPNPAFARVGVPLVSTFMLSNLKGKEAYIEPVIEGDGVQFHGESGQTRRTQKGRRTARSLDGQTSAACYRAWRFRATTSRLRPRLDAWACG